MNLEEARIRLEGALERLESIEGPLREAQALLDARDWRTRWSLAPHLFAVLTAGAPNLEGDLARARQLLRRERCPELDASVGRLEQTHSAFLRTALRRTGSDAPLPALLEEVQRQARELPVPIAGDEPVVLAGRAGAFGRRSSNYTLTARRLLVEGTGTDPTEVRLVDLVPGSVRVGGLLRTLELTARSRFRLPLAENPYELARALELERWLASVGAAPPRAPPRTQLLVLSYVGTHVPRGARFPTATLVLTPEAYALLPTTRDADLSLVVGNVLGSPLRVPLTLDPFVQSLSRCDPDRATAALDQLARALGTKVDRTRRVFHLKGFFSSVGFVGDVGLLWFEPQNYQQVQQVGAMLAGWDQRYLDELSRGGFRFRL